MKRCKHAIVESSFNTSYNKEEKRFEEYDIIDGIPKSRKGIWLCPEVICGRFEEADEQFRKNQGFFFCDESRCDKCEFYESSITDIKIKPKRNPIDHRLRHEVFKRDGFTCKECGAKKKDGATLHVDHKMPLSRGGSDELDNLQTLCDKCNLSKSNKIFKEEEDGKTT